MVQLQCYKIINFTTPPFLITLYIPSSSLFDNCTAIDILENIFWHVILLNSHRNSMRKAGQVLCSHFTDEGIDPDPRFLISSTV